MAQRTAGVREYKIRRVLGVRNRVCPPLLPLPPINANPMEVSYQGESWGMPLSKEDIGRKTRILKPGNVAGNNKVCSFWLGGNLQ